MIFIPHDNDFSRVRDKFYTITCPNCGTKSNISAVSFPRFEIAARFNLERVGVVYSCDACHGPVFVSFMARILNGRLNIDESTFRMINQAIEPFDFQHIPSKVAVNFREALECYSIQAYNGFAAMCRRTIQSACTDLGTSGTDKIVKQITELKDIAQLNDEIFSVLKQIIIDGHDGAHPHLPPVDSMRADVLLMLVKDILYELYIRRGQLQEAQKRRKDAIEANKGTVERSK